MASQATILKINWKPVRLEDKDWYQPIVAAENSQSADFPFANIYIWDEKYHQSLARVDGMAIVKLGFGANTQYACPIGQGPVAPVVDALRQDAMQTGVPFHLLGVSKPRLSELTALYQGQFDVEGDRDYYDYIYLAENLSELGGKKLQSKRNHINRFMATYNWSFEPLTADKTAECLEMFDRWTAIHGINSAIRAEHKAIARGFKHFDYLGLAGGILRVDGDIVAFTVGEPLNSDTFCIHFEKAFPSIRGSYAMINREFVRMIQKRYPSVRYINREEDMGIAGLRQAKQSYQPAYLVEKYNLVWKNDRL